MTFTLEIDCDKAALEDRSGEIARILREIADSPCAAEGLVSYRCRGRYGWIMIGAKDDDDAYREALRSNPDVSRKALEMWNGERYVPLT